MEHIAQDSGYMLPMREQELDREEQAASLIQDITMSQSCLFLLLSHPLPVPTLPATDILQS